MDVATRHPLTTAQKAFWEKQSTDAESPGVIVGLSIDLFIEVQPELLRASLQALLDRSDALRTAFTRVDATLWQVIEGEATAPLSVLDLSGPSHTDESRARAVEEWAQHPFDLSVAPLIDNLLVRVGPAHWTWHCRAHHLVIDAGGAAIGISAILGAYATLANGGTPDLSYLGRYSEHMDDDAAYLASNRHHADLAYWVARHATPAPRLFRRGEGRVRPIATRSSIIHRASYDALIESGKANGVQPFHVFVAALGALGYRLFDRTSLSLGLATHNRTSELDRRTVGMFAGTMAFRLDVDPEQSLADLAREASRLLRRDYRHARLPLPHLASVIGSGNTPLFDLALSFQPASYEMEVNGARVELRAGIFAGMDTEAAAIHIRDPQGSSPLAIDLTHRPDLVRTDDVVCMYDSLVRVLDEWPKISTQSVARFSLET